MKTLGLGTGIAAAPESHQVRRALSTTPAPLPIRRQAVLGAARRYNAFAL